jgi:hypothetical protein
MKLLNHVGYKVLSLRYMVVDTDTNNAATQEDSKKGEFPDVPKEAIVRPEDEKPVRTTKRSEEELSGEEDEPDYEGVDSSSDMDGDGNPDWDPAVGPGV